MTTALRLGPPPTVLNSNVAIFCAGATQTARSCTKKRPSLRPLLPANQPISAVYMPYLLSYCAGAAVVPRSCRCWPSLALACAAAVSCAMGRGEWLCCCCICCIAALYLLLLLLLLPCSPSCCLCCGCCRCCLAYFVLLLWLLPLLPTTLCFF